VEPQKHPLRDFYSKIYPTYDRVNRVFTFGRDRAWRRKAARACLEHAPASVLDVCTGTGDFLFEVARLAGRETRTLRLEGYDFTPEMLEEARQKAREQAGLEGASFAFTEGDVGNMPYGEESFEAMGITFGIRNLVYENDHADRHLEELFRVLKKGGVLVVLESSRPDHPLWRLLNNIYLQFILPYLGGLLSGNLRAYRYLATSSRNYYSRAEMAAILEEKGFTVRQNRPLFLGSVMLVVAGK
jgi:demethylmenaquinone methyltransferase/2-methoxy-6-polyprenyl-1,4-benzoquinol methylase